MNGHAEKLDTAGRGAVARGKSQPQRRDQTGLLYLQATAGNRAVAGLLSRRAPSLHLQRHGITEDEARSAGLAMDSDEEKSSGGGPTH